MASLASSPSSSLLLSKSSSNLLPPTLSSTSRLSFSSFSYSSSLSISPFFLTYPSSSGSRRFTTQSGFSIRASAEKKKVLIVNTNSGGHAVIGFYFAKELLGFGHAVTILTVGEESSDKMKKPPFSRFSVRNFVYLILIIKLLCNQNAYGI
ncbi:hypothetical protein L6164_010098 [Bauhinia variegata]|uniref:Uncharacterized protein n=1 Tax=Bauhinia variegata TaxID=167791 RepID=A0ACB9PM47_BAUVA|nr:hypothetical protein L6164_010098 [Bauhinia variegata]